MKDKLDISLMDAENVQVVQMSKELAPLDQQLDVVARSSDVIMLGEGNHFDAETKKYSELIFLSVLELVDRSPIVFLEASDAPRKMLHFDYVIRFCQEHGIPFHAVDTANIPIVGDPGLYPERDIAIASNIKMVMEKNPGSVGIFIGGSNHCNKEGIHIKDLSGQGQNYDYPSAASLLKNELRVGSVALHFMHKKEMLAKRVDESKEILSLPGKYAKTFISQGISSSGELHPVRHLIKPESFDMIAFLPTLERRILNIFSGNSKRITYVDDEEN